MAKAKPQPKKPPVKAATNESATLYRGVGGSFWNEGLTSSRIAAGSTVPELGYMSTTLDEAVTRRPEFGNILIRIRAPKGTLGAPLIDERVSIFGADQQEFLLERGQALRIRKVRRANERTIIDADLIHRAKK